jgi:molybdopterin/thiamine biosynthesis adenylyltransferase
MTPRNHYIIGCGGVGSWLAPSLTLLLDPSQVSLIDGDTLEEKNLNRQLFSSEDIGHNKAQALAKRYNCGFRSDWYLFGLIEHTERDWLFVCVDNNPARVAALQACDQYGCQAIIAANETTSSEAYFYRPRWKGTRLDPRVYYPELLSDQSGDPRAAQAGCTGDAQERNRQLVTANASAAALAANLFVLWGVKAHIITRDMMPMMPFKFVQNLSKTETHRIEDRATKTRTQNE